MNYYHLIWLFVIIICLYMMMGGKLNRLDKI